MNSVLPAMELSWHGITVKSRTQRHPPDEEDGFKSSSHRNYILQDVFGVAYPGEVLALMGASGAGKTTLLNILTKRNLSSLKATGVIRLNGTEVDRYMLKRMSAYVQQDDLFIGSMTV